MTGRAYRRCLGSLIACVLAATIAACTGTPPAPPPTHEPASAPQPTRQPTHPPRAAGPDQRVTDLTPRPVDVRRLGGSPFVLTRRTRINIDDRRAHAVGGYLARVLRSATGYPMPLVDGTPRAGDIVLRLHPTAGLAGHTAQGYRLTVHANRVIAQSPATAGLFHAVQTLRQLLPVWIEAARPVDATWTVAPVSIVDYPRFTYRGVMLDVARSFLTVAEVERFIDAAAMFKLDYLHLHLTDDQAWRIAIHDPTTNPAGIDYHALTAVGAHGGADDLPDGTPRPTGRARRGYYTQAEYRQIVRYARSRHITVVPEIDGPAHTNAALAAVPALDPDGRAQPMNTTSAVGYSTLDAHSPVTYAFLRTVWRQLAAMTPGPYLHVGGDEAHSTPAAAYVEYVRKVVAIVDRLGKHPVGWNDYAAAPLPAGAVIQYWHGSLTRVLRRVRAGARVIMSPANRTYLDQKYDAAMPLGLDWACRHDCGVLHYYTWNPVERGLREQDVLGVEAPLWSETVRGLAQAEYLAFPRLIATAEIGWTPQRLRRAPDFRRRLAAVGARLTIAGVNFHPGKAVDWRITLLTPQSPVPADGALALVVVPGRTRDRLHVQITTARRRAIDAHVRCTPPASSFRTLGVCTVTAAHGQPAPAGSALTVTVRARGRTPATGTVRLTR